MKARGLVIVLSFAFSLFVFSGCQRTDNANVAPVASPTAETIDTAAIEAELTRIENRMPLDRLFLLFHRLRFDRERLFALTDVIVSGDSKQRVVRFAAGEIGETVGRLAGARIPVFAHYHQLQFGRVPGFSNEFHWQGIADLACGNRECQARALCSHTFDCLSPERFLLLLPLIRVYARDALLKHIELFFHLGISRGALSWLLQQIFLSHPLFFRHRFKLCLRDGLAIDRDGLALRIRR